MSAEAQSVAEERKRQREFEAEQRTLQEAFNQQGELSRPWMRELLDVDDLEERLQPNTIRKIQGLLNKQWVLSNLTDAETHDRVHWLEVMKYKIYGEHPPPESAIRGPIRAFLYDDPWEELQPLTPGERNEIDQIIQGLKNRVTRSRGGFERKQQQTSIARTERESDGEDDSGGLSLFG